MIGAKVTGIPDLREALRGIVPKLRVRALRNALAAGARVVQASARAATPVLNASSLAVRKGYRAPGTVRKAISVRTSRAARAAGDVGVYVNVKPAKGARYATRTARVFGLKVRNRVQVRASQRGAKSPRDPYYWRFIEFGTQRGVRAYGFLQRGAQKLPEALQVFVAKIGPAIARLNRPKAPAP
jgi:HK97 gp10 family phage protein